MGFAFYVITNTKHKNKMQYYIGIDNGVTGSIAVLDENGKCLVYTPTPVREVLNYTKKKELIKRLDTLKLLDMLRPYAENATVVMERPMTNPKLQWKSTVSAIRCDEAMLVAIEQLKCRHRYCDSREWQRAMLPGLKVPKKARSKKASMTQAEKTEIEEEQKVAKKFNATLKRQTKKISLAQGQQLYPDLELKDDADALHIADWARVNKM